MRLGVTVTDAEADVEGLVDRLGLCVRVGVCVWLSESAWLEVADNDGDCVSDGVGDTLAVPEALDVLDIEAVLIWLCEIDPLGVSVPLGVRDSLAVSEIDADCD